MKTFDVLEWIRGVRDARCEQERELTAPEKLRRTKQEAAALRAPRPQEKSSTSPAAKVGD